MDQTIHYIQQGYQWLEQVLGFTLFTIGGSDFTTWTIIYLVALIILLMYFSNKLKFWLSEVILARQEMNIGLRETIGTLVRYVFIVIGFIVILQTVGIDLSSLTVLAGAVGVGVGFGLQNIVNNFFSGLIVLFERPIKVGDRVEVGNVLGNVRDISIRATTVITNDNISIIVPNSEFISARVINWSHNDPNIRFDIPVGVSYSSNPELVRDLLLQVARAEEAVLTTPAPDVIFKEFGDSSLNFILRVWTYKYHTNPLVLRSRLNFAIFKIFAENDVEIPFPQRDLHLRSGQFVSTAPAPNGGN